MKIKRSAFVPEVRSSKHLSVFWMFVIALGLPALLSVMCTTVFLKIAAAH